MIGIILISRLQIDIGGITYTYKSQLILSCIKNASALTLLNLKKYYIKSP